MPAPWPNVPQRICEWSEPSLASEIAELRKEIAALRAELAPVPSLIMTGRRALDEFKRLTTRPKGVYYEQYKQRQGKGNIGLL